jgi:predicted thioesterase
LTTAAGTKPGLTTFVVTTIVGCAAAVSVLGATVAVLAALAREVGRGTAASVVANSEGADSGECRQHEDGEMHGIGYD